MWLTRMHSSRMRTGRTLTVFRCRPPRKFGGTPPPKIWRPPENLETPPRKFGGTPPSENLETPPPPWTESQTPVKTLPWPKLRFGR